MTAAAPASAAERLARGRARLRAGAEAEAEADFAAAAADEAVERAVEIERGLLALRRAAPPEDAHAAATRALAAPLDALVRARALLLRGVAEHRLDRPSRALADLVEALAAADASGDVATRVDVLRATGTVHAWRGRHAEAALHLTLALADAAALGDRALLADVVGELGRVQLEMRRHAHALALFRRQADLVGDRIDPRGRCRLDLVTGQAMLGAGLAEDAARKAREALAAASRRGFAYLTVIASRDLALAELRCGRLDAAREALARSRTVPFEPDSYEAAALDAAEAELAAAEDRDEAADLLARAVEAWAKRDLAGPEIELRLLEADVLMRRGARHAAERTLASALARARARGLSLLADSVREAMTRLDVTEALADETRKPLAARFAEAQDGYVLLEKLGGGQFGTVFRAFDVERAREVALKRFALGDDWSPERRAALLASARAELACASRVVHPGVARAIAVGEAADGSFYVVQEFVEGGSLRAAFADRAGATPRRIALTLARVAQALAALHAAGVVHRDVKPDNILCPALDRPVLVDFGIAALGGEASAGGAGTPGYAPPELLRGEAGDALSDLYALGAVAFEWLLGRPPAAAPTTRGWFDLRRTVLAAEDRAALESAAGRALAALVAEMLALAPNGRPASAAAAAARFEDVLRGADPLRDTAGRRTGGRP